jgi:hypothetical protein
VISTCTPAEVAIAVAHDDYRVGVEPPCSYSWEHSASARHCRPNSDSHVASSSSIFDGNHHSVLSEPLAGPADLADYLQHQIVLRQHIGAETSDSVRALAHIAAHNGTTAFGIAAHMPVAIRLDKKRRKLTDTPLVRKCDFPDFART